MSAVCSLLKSMVENCVLQITPCIFLSEAYVSVFSTYVRYLQVSIGGMSTQVVT